MLRFILPLLLVASFPANSEKPVNPEILKFNMGDSGGNPPFNFYDPASRKPRGIMFDIAREIFRGSSIQLKPVSVPRKRLTQLVDMGKIDITALAKEWTSNPQSKTWTDSVVSHRDVLFSLASYPLDFRDTEDLTGFTLRKRFGYHYPSLQHYFNSGEIAVIDDYSEELMLEGLFLRPKLAQAAIMNELVGLWLIAKNGWHNRYTFSTTSVHEVAYRYLLAPNRKNLVPLINKSLQEMKDNGQLEIILNRYRN